MDHQHLLKNIEINACTFLNFVFLCVFSAKKLFDLWNDLCFAPK